ncbi:MAG: hypothetical protein R2748_11225 [Bryobacterales bacterium]
MTIESQGGASRVAAGYITPTPIWKSSYRLVFDGQERPMLEGWAIVDNTSGEDWDGVTLSLVSGLPVSFISRLYEPRYLQRPVIQLAQDRAWTPKVHGGALEEMPEAEMALAEPPPPPAPMMAKAADSRAFRQQVMGGVAGAALADESGFRRNEITSTVAATGGEGRAGRSVRIPH